MTDALKGVLFMVAASITWGLSPLYYAQMAELGPVLIIAHRTIWSLVFFVLLLSVQGRLSALPSVFSGSRQIITILGAALAISTNWLVFIFAILNDHSVEASVGYYIFPLVAVALGAVFLKERLSTIQWLAVSLGVAAVLVLTIGLGVAPWIALILGASFGLYGLLKKGLNIGPVVSVAAEVLLLTPIALIVIAVFMTQGVPVFGITWRETALLLGSGIMTGLPLVFFSAATRRISYATIGLLQYINPTLQVIVAVLFLGGVFTRWHLMALALIWIALALYSFAAFQSEKRRSRQAKASLPVSTG